MNPEPPNPGLDRVRFSLRADGIQAASRNPLVSGIHHRGYLPHVKREGASYFVTFRLHDSLPKETLLHFEQKLAASLRNPDLNQTIESEARREFLRKVERFLDTGAGECWLKRPEIADMVADSLRHFDGDRYLLDAWVVMPNHVHLLLWPMPNHPLSEILQSRKRHTARQANLLLGRTGQPFWQPESFDHWVRDDDEKARIQRYIFMNPVTAKLCAGPKDWKWSSAWDGWQKSDDTKRI